jgi:hypothetical protein
LAKRALLTVSGSISETLDADVAAGRRPRADYIELAAALDADLLDYVRAERGAGPIGRLLRRVGGPNALLAWICFRRSGTYDAILTDGEQVGIPYAALSWLRLWRRRPEHSMIVHIMSTRSKVLVFKALGLRHRIDRLFVYATAQQEFAVERLKVRADRVALTTFMVDTAFFAPEHVVADRRRMICAAGLELRDYETLVEAVRDLDVEVVIAAASPWSKRTSAVADRPAPANVSVCKLNLFELRQLYADALFVVMPLHDVEFQAGVTTILEAMSMAKAVVCTRTAGQTDTIVDDVTGVYVPPKDPAALRAAIVALLDDPARAERIGQAGRSWVVAHADIVEYSRRIGAAVSGGLSGATGPSRSYTVGTTHTRDGR